MNRRLSQAILKVSLLEEGPEHLGWHCAHTSGKGIATVSNPIAFKRKGRRACMRIPHTNQKQYTKHDDIQGSLTNNVRKR